MRRKGDILYYECDLGLGTTLRSHGRPRQERDNPPLVATLFAEV